MGDIFRHDITINNSKKLLLLDKKSNNYKSLGELARALFVKGYTSSSKAINLVGGGGGATYTAGDGIDITNNEISVKVGDGISFDGNDRVSLNNSTKQSLQLADSSLQNGDNISKLVNDVGYLLPTSRVPNPYDIIIKLNGSEIGRYNGDTEKEINIISGGVAPTDYQPNMGILNNRSLSHNSLFTPEKDGWLVLSNNSHTNSAEAYIKLGSNSGRLIFATLGQGGGSMSYNNCSSGIIPVKAGVTYYVHIGNYRGYYYYN